MTAENLDEFRKTKNFLVCIDSDGTAIDAMTVKHERCFGPCFVKEWGLERWEKEALSLWNDINLYRRTRGYNRFLTLYEALCEVNGTLKAVEGLPELKEWLDGASLLSNQSLEEAAEKTGSGILKKALAWSQAVNAATMLLTYDDKKPFDGVREFLEEASQRADIAVVSSAGRKIIAEEWMYHRLAARVGAIASQEDGSKKDCISRLLKKGYEPSDVLMIGDALVDMNAAESCGVHFYPIRAGEESEAWKALKNRYFESFLSGTYAETESELKNEFIKFFEKGEEKW